MTLTNQAQETVDKRQLERLARKFIAGKATEAEKAFLDSYYQQFESEPHILDSFTAAETQALEQQMRERILKNIRSGKKQTKVYQIGLFRKHIRWVAAAVFLFAIATTYLLIENRKEKRSPVVAKIDVIAPQTNRAMITRANGETVYLDSAANGKLASLGNVTLEKLADGQIAYSGNKSNNNGGKVEINTITNPRGSKVIDMTLTDGTHVWLNAGSSLTYTVPLINRDVTVTGEAYFEVAHDAAKQFTVTKGDTKVTVLGTHFNVNAYDDESEIRVTLLEGSVRVNKGTMPQVIIKPGQQAKVSNQINIGQDVDLEQVMAWKNGRFELGGNTIEPIMRQIARWYDVEIEYRGPMPKDNFMGSTSKQENVSELLKILEQTKAVHFGIEGKKIIVNP